MPRAENDSSTFSNFASGRQFRRKDANGGPEKRKIVIPATGSRVKPFDSGLSAIIAVICLEAFLRYKKGRYAARLNMGDCFTYATAKIARMPVLFVGSDSSRTDLTAA